MQLHGADAALWAKMESLSAILHMLLNLEAAPAQTVAKRRLELQAFCDLSRRQ